MPKIVCVCLGNICRSPMAEGILRMISHKHQLGWLVDSAGTAGYHIGEAPDTRSISVAQRHQIDITKHKARKFRIEDYNEFDLILVMDQENLLDVLKLAPDQRSTQKVKLYRHDGKDVQDPYYGVEGDFLHMFDVLMKNGLEWKDVVKHQ